MSKDKHTSTKLIAITLTLFTMTGMATAAASNLAVGADDKPTQPDNTALGITVDVAADGDQVTLQFTDSNGDSDTVTLTEDTADPDSTVDQNIDLTTLSMGGSIEEGTMDIKADQGSSFSSSESSTTVEVDGTAPTVSNVEIYDYGQNSDGSVYINKGDDGGIEINQPQLESATGLTDADTVSDLKSISDLTDDIDGGSPTLALNIHLSGTPNLQDPYTASNSVDNADALYATYDSGAGHWTITAWGDSFDSVGPNKATLDGATDYMVDSLKVDGTGGALSDSDIDRITVSLNRDNDYTINDVSLETGGSSPSSILPGDGALDSEVDLLYIDGVVDDGDRVTVTSDISDSSTIDSTSFDASEFGGGTGSLSQLSGTWMGDFTVGTPGNDGDNKVTVSATDAAGNGGSQDVESGTLTLDNNNPSANTPSLSTTPVTDSETGDGNEVTATVTFSEEMDQNTGDVTVTPDVDGDLTTSPTVENKRWVDSTTFKADLQFTDDNEDVSGVTLKVNGAKDLDGNTITSAVTKDYSVNTKNPDVSSIKTFDSDSNGQLDGVTVTYSEDIKDSSVGTDDISFDTTRPLSGASETSSGVVDYTFSSEEGDTGTTPSVNFNTANIQDTDGNNLASGQDATASDEAAPVILSVTTYDIDDDGDVGAATLTASEVMDGNLGTASDYEIGGTDADSVNAQEYTDDTGSTGSDSGDKFRVELSDGNEIDGTDAKQVNYDGSSATDGSGNNLVTLTDGDVDETDGAEPVAVSGTFSDQDKNGKVDQATLTFSEGVQSSSSLESGDFAVTGTDSSVLGDTSVSNPSFSASDTVKVDLTEGSADTALSGGISLDYTASAGTSDSITDGSNAAPDTSSTLSDNANPVLEHAEIDNSASSSSSTHATLEFSEQVKDTSNNGDGVKIAGSNYDVDSSLSNTHTVNLGSELQTGDMPNVTSFKSEVQDGAANTAVLKSGSNVEIDTFRRQLSSGWNFVSFPIAGTSTPEISNVIDTSNVNAVWKYNDGQWMSYKPGRSDSNNDFTQVEGGVGYQIDASSQFTIAPNVNNVQTTQAPQEVTLEEGYNLVGQFEEFNQKADADSGTGAFYSIGSSTLGHVYKQQSGLQVTEMTSSGDIKTGNAYWVQTVGDLSGGTVPYTAN